LIGLRIGKTSSEPTDESCREACQGLGCEMHYLCKCITYGRDHGETVNGRVDEAPRAAAAVRGRARFERVVQLLLELYQFPAGRLFPLVRAHPPAVSPQPVQEVSLHPLHATLVERLESALCVTEHHTSHAAHDHQYHLYALVMSNIPRQQVCRTCSGGITLRFSRSIPLPFPRPLPLWTTPLG